MNLYSGSREERNSELENSGFCKKRFFSAAKLKKTENCAVVGTFSGQGLSPGEDEGCFLICSIIVYTRKATDHFTSQQGPPVV